MIPGHLHSIPQYSTKGTLTPRLLLGDISNFEDLTVPFLRAFKFPETWTAISSINIIPNLSPTSEHRTAPGTLFYPDPAKRIFAVTVEFDRCVNQPSQIMILEESSLRPAMRTEPPTLTWPQWKHWCIVNNISDQADCFKVVGRRLMYLQPIGDTATKSRLYTIEFKPPGPSRYQSTPLYHHGEGPPILCPSRGAALIKHRTTPSPKSNAMDVYNITMFDASEDSIVLYDETAKTTQVRMLTFGKAATARGSTFKAPCKT